MIDDRLSTGPVVLIVGDDSSLLVEDTVRAAGLTPSTIGIDGATTIIDTYPSVGCIVLVNMGEWDRPWLSLIDRIDASRVADEAGWIAVFGADALDEVAGRLLATPATLLCDPSPGELAAALVVATSGGRPEVQDSRREAAKTQALNDEIARFVSALSRLNAAEPPPAPAVEGYVADRGSGYGAPPPAIEARTVRTAIRARRLRDEAFGIPGAFEDPAWDMLLDLFAAELERRRVSVSSLCIAAAVAPTTALRWIGKMIEWGLLERRPDDEDRRRAYISLTARASTAMRHYVGLLARNGLTLG